MDRNDFDGYDNLDAYWYQEDAIRSLDYDVYFSLGRNYYCDAGCKVCYIQKNLKKTKKLQIYGNDLSKYLETWKDFFSYFGSVRTNDDLYYFKEKFPAEYKWYQENGKLFELCVTDNSLVRTLQLDDVVIKKIADVSISTEFVESVGSNKVVQYLEEAYNRFGIDKIKFIDCKKPEVLEEIIKWSNDKGLYNCVHHDMRNIGRVMLHHNWAEYQNTWVETTEDKVIKANKEAIHLYYDRFYFTCDDACDPSVESFYDLPEKFNPEELMYKIIKGKQTLYKDWVSLSKLDKFKQYFSITQNYVVEPNFNFIPHIMYQQESPFINKLMETGWLKTKLGLYKPSTETVIPLLRKL